MPLSCLQEWISVQTLMNLFRWLRCSGVWCLLAFISLFLKDLRRKCVPGTIDADYRGEVCIILVNLSAETFVIEDGERIEQMVIARHEQALWQEVEVLDETERGAGGFGHTGKK